MNNYTNRNLFGIKCPRDLLFYFTFLPLTILVLSGCAITPQAFNDGAEFYKNGNYHAAARSFDDAATQMKDDGKLPFLLADSHYKAARADSKKTDESDQLNLTGIIGNLTTALEHTKKSLSTLKPALAQPYDGPSMLDKLQVLKDDKFKPQRELQLSLNDAALKFKVLLDEKLQMIQAKLDKILGETNQLLTLSKSKPADAYDQFVPYFVYAMYVPEVNSEKLQIETTLLKLLETTGLDQVKKSKYKFAQTTFDRAGKIEGGQNIATVGGYLITSHGAFQKKDYALAFEKLLAIRAIDPENTFLKEYFEKTQLLLLNSKLAEVDSLIDKGKLSGLLKSFEILEKITDPASDVVQGNPKFLDMINQRKTNLRSLTAREYIQRAKQLISEDEFLYSSLILRSLRLARQFDPEQVKEMENEVVKANGVTAKKKEMRVFVSYVGKTELSNEWAKRLTSDLFDMLDKSGIPGLSVQDTNSLKDANPRNIAATDLVIKGNIDNVDFTERGRDSPRSRSSKYISGTRTVTNPDYQPAWQSCREAEARYNSMAQQMQQLSQQCNSLDGFLAQSACKVGLSVVSSYEKDAACGKARSTPQSLTKNIISNYQYEFYTISLSKSVQSNCSLADNLSNTEIRCAPIGENSKSEGTMISKSQPTDTEGIRDGEDHVPNLADEKDSTYNKILAAVSEEVKQKVIADIGERFCKLAKSKKENLHAVEAASLCEFAVNDEQKNLRDESNAKLNAYFLISPEKAQLYGVQSKTEAASWPTTFGEVGDKDIQKARMKMAAK